MNECIALGDWRDAAAGAGILATASLQVTGQGCTGSLEVQAQPARAALGAAREATDARQFRKCEAPSHFRSG